MTAPSYAQEGSKSQHRHQPIKGMAWRRLGFCCHCGMCLSPLLTD